MAMKAAAIPVSIRLRADLKWSPYADDKPNLWVAHDPVHREFYFFSTAERLIASLLDGNHSLGEVVEKCRCEYPTVTEKFVSQLIRRLDQASLLLHRDWKPLPRMGSRWSSRSMACVNSLLAWRIPLFNPSRAIDWLEPVGRVFFSKWSLMILVFSVFGCLLVLANRGSVLAADLTAMSLTLRGDRWLIAASLLFCIKVMHEVGHALACKTIGANCREMGLFVLFGAPCMYCDVSDTWRVSDRWRRILVSSAGMIVEVAIAVVATVVWLSSSEPWMRGAALQVMLFSSVVTVFVNANPLLRYDGYYILSDWVGIPNLSEQSRDAWSKLGRNIVFNGLQGCFGWREVMLAIFHFFSSCYRWFMIAVLVWGVNQWFLDRRLGGFGGIFTAIILVAVSTSAMRGWKSFFLNGSENSRVSWFRLGTIGIAGLLLIWTLCVWNMPQSVFGRGVLESFEQTGLYARRSAMVNKVVTDGSWVEAQSVVVETESYELELERCRALGEFQVAKVRWQQTANRSVDDPLAAQQMAEQEKSRIAIQERVEKLDQELSQLHIRTQVAGTFFQSLREPVWIGTGINRKMHRMRLGDIAPDWPTVERGDAIGRVALTGRWQVKAYINELKIRRCKLGAKVRVRLDQLPGQTLAGQVTSIASENIQVTPKELVGDTLFASTHSEWRIEAKPERNTYSVVVELDTPRGQAISKGLASVQIETATRTPIAVFADWLKGIWRFERAAG